MKTKAIKQEPLLFIYKLNVCRTTTTPERVAGWLIVQASVSVCVCVAPVFGSKPLLGW